MKLPVATALLHRRHRRALNRAAIHRLDHWHALCVVTFFALIFIVVRTLLFGDPVSGRPSLASIGIFIGGVQLLRLGIMGQYLAKTYLETKNRPLYIVRESTLMNRSTPVPLPSAHFRTSSRTDGDGNTRDSRYSIRHASQNSLSCASKLINRLGPVVYWSACLAVPVLILIVLSIWRGITPSNTNRFSLKTSSASTSTSSRDLDTCSPVRRTSPIHSLRTWAQTPGDCTAITLRSPSASSSCCSTKPISPLRSTS